jgi:hypothetical protein
LICSGYITFTREVTNLVVAAEAGATSMICWTILHQTAAPVAQGAARIAHALRRAVGHMAPRAVRVAHYTATVSGPPRTWAEVVCRFVPAAIAGGGLLIPVPASPPRSLDPPVAFVEPAPAISLWPIGSLGYTGAIGFLGDIGPIAPVNRYDPVETVAKAVPEPSSALVLLGGLGGLLLIRTRRMRLGHTPRTGSHTTAAKQSRATRFCRVVIRSSVRW